MAAAVLANSAFAAPSLPSYPVPTGATPVVSNGDCANHLDSVQITKITTIFSDSDPSRVGGQVNSSNLNATNCLGFVLEPDNDWGDTPSPNVGALFDGMLNGQLSPAGFGDYYVDPNTFLTNDKDQWKNPNAPGWIALAGGECNDDADCDYPVYNDVGGVSNLASLLDISFGIGTWSLTIPDPQALLVAISGELGDAAFDHLTFVLKGANKKKDTDAGTWAIFDFNFWDLIAEYENDPNTGADIRFDELYNFEGTWDTGVIRGKDLSHWSVWVHDPPASSFEEIPVPAPLLLMAPALIMLMRKRFTA